MKGWNRAGPWTVYFCSYFDAPSSYRTFLGADFVTDDLVEFGSETSYESDSARLGALFTFNETSVVSRVGVSFISSEQACSNVNAEIPDGATLEDVRDETRESWNSQVFSKVTTTETNVTKLNQLYTALYFMHLLPTNKTGENPLWESDEPYFDDIFTFWDIVCHQKRPSCCFLAAYANVTRLVSLSHAAVAHPPASLLRRVDTLHG